MPVKEQIGIVISNKMEKNYCGKNREPISTSNVFKNNDKDEKIFSP